MNWKFAEIYQQKSDSRTLYTDRIVQIRIKFTEGWSSQEAACLIQVHLHDNT